MKNVEIAKYLSFFVSLITAFKTSICLVINNKGINNKNDQNILCIKTSIGSTDATCLK